MPKTQKIIAAALCLTLLGNEGVMAAVSGGTLSPAVNKSMAIQATPFVTQALAPLAPSYGGFPDFKRRTFIRAHLFVAAAFVLNLTGRKAQAKPQLVRTLEDLFQNFGLDANAPYKIDGLTLTFDGEVRPGAETITVTVGKNKPIPATIKDGRWTIQAPLKNGKNDVLLSKQEIYVHFPVVAHNPKPVKQPDRPTKEKSRGDRLLNMAGPSVWSWILLASAALGKGSRKTSSDEKRSYLKWELPLAIVACSAGLLAEVGWIVYGVNAYIPLLLYRIGVGSILLAIGFELREVFKSPMVPEATAAPVGGKDASKLDMSTEVRLGKAMQNAQGPWTIVYIDLDDMKDFNEDLGKAQVDRNYRDRIGHLIENTFPGIIWGYAGGDEIFLLLPLSLPTAYYKIDQLRSDFKWYVPDPDLGPMMFSAGLATRDQIISACPDWKNLTPQEFFAVAKELSSQGLTLVKVYLKKDAVLFYKILTDEEKTLKNAALFRAELEHNPLDPSAYDDQMMRNLQAAQGQDIPVEVAGQVRQFAEFNDFREALKKEWSSGRWNGKPVAVGSIFPYYRGEAFVEAMELLRETGNRIYGSWVGFKVWNSWEKTGTSGDHVIRAERMVITRALSEAFTHRLPPEWRGELWIVRRRPDAFFYALVSASPTAASSLESVYAILDDALKGAQETLAPGQAGKHMFKNGFDLTLQNAIRVYIPRALDTKFPSTNIGENIFAPLDILQNWLARILKQSDPTTAPRTSFVWLGPGQALMQYQLEANQAERAERRAAARQRLQARVIKPETADILRRLAVYLIDKYLQATHQTYSLRAARTAA